MEPTIHTGEQPSGKHAPAPACAPSPESAGHRGGVWPRTRTVNLVVAAACILSLVPIVALGIFDRPSADDFAYSILTHAAFQETGGNPLAVLGAAVQTSADYYASWQGLYSSAFLLALQPGIAGSPWYALGCYALLAFMYFSTLFLARCVEVHALGLKGGLWPAAGMLLATLYVQCMPFANEGLYWYNGAANYDPTFFGSLIACGLCICAFDSPSRGKRAALVAGAAALSLALSGGNYMPAFFNLMAMACFAALGLLKRRPSFLAPLVASAAGFAISMLAPGTTIRQAALDGLTGGHPSIAGTLFHSAVRVVKDLALFVNVPALLAFAALAPIIVWWAHRSPRCFSWKAFGLGVLIAFVLYLGTLCVPYYSFGNSGEGRTRDAAFFICVTLALGVYGMGLCCLTAHADRFREWARRAGTRLSVPVVALVACVAVGAMAFLGSYEQGAGNAAIAAECIASGEAQEYVREYDAREEVLLRNVGGTAVIEPLECRPTLLFFSDIVRGSDDWSWAVAAYYGLQEVIVQE